ncbi:hypothetical protein DAI22_04g201100 [Oryza sativa Japonica Group]|nr:hypothetical protein DAI22_04g201100 [Oryza sativa Japonica Group]
MRQHHQSRLELRMHWRPSRCHFHSSHSPSLLYPFLFVYMCSYFSEVRIAYIAIWVENLSAFSV